MAQQQNLKNRRTTASIFNMHSILTPKSRPKEYATFRIFKSFTIRTIIG